NLATDQSHCGSCANTCVGGGVVLGLCTGGVCSCGCSAGLADCDHNCGDGCETNLGTDPQNCGGCAIACSPNHVAVRTCAGGLCNGICATGYADCNGNRQVDGCEVDAMNDSLNC